jgi:VWFA-related protein
MILRAWLALAILSAAAVTASSMQTPVFKTRVESIRVDVLVTANGRPLRGLGPLDFEVRDNDVLQTVDYAAFEEIPLNVVLALDTSASVKGDRLDHLGAASSAVLDGLESDDQSALVTFGQGVVVRSPLTPDHARTRLALDSIEPGGDTALVDAAYAGMVLAEADVGRGLLLVFSDALDVNSWLQEDSVLDIAKRSDVVAYGVTARSRARPEFLEALGEVTGGDLVEIESPRDLRQTFLSILGEFRHRYLVSYSPRGVARGGWHRLEVKVKRRGARVKARPGYLGSS